MVGAATSDELLHHAVTMLLRDACYARHAVSIAESLLKHKACVNAQHESWSGASPLHIAASAGDEGMALVLLQAGVCHVFSALSYVITHRC